MRLVINTLALITVAFALAVAQNVQAQRAIRRHPIDLRTAVDHLTVIELAEPVVQVACGSALFKVEWRGNRVFIQPTTADARTNLFIWTATERLTYELEPAHSADDIDFVVEESPNRPTPAASLDPHLQRAPATVSQLLIETQPVFIHSPYRASHPVEVRIDELYEKDGQLLVRYIVINHGRDPYLLKPPAVFQLQGVRSSQSLFALKNSQLSDEQAHKLKVKRRVPLKTLEQRLQSDWIAPSTSATGIVLLEFATTSEPTLLSLEFSNESAVSSSTLPSITAYIVK